MIQVLKVYPKGGVQTRCFVATVVHPRSCQHTCILTLQDEKFHWCVMIYGKSIAMGTPLMLSPLHVAMAATHVELPETELWHAPSTRRLACVMHGQGIEEMAVRAQK